MHEQGLAAVLPLMGLVLVQVVILGLQIFNLIKLRAFVAAREAIAKLEAELLSRPVTDEELLAALDRHPG